MGDSVLCKDDIDTSDVELRDADTLGGQYTATDITNINTSIISLENAYTKSYNTIAQLPMGSSYTCDADCFIKINHFASSSSGTGGMVKINGIEVYMSASTTTQHTFVIPLKKGNIITSNEYARGYLMKANM